MVVKSAIGVLLIAVGTSHAFASEARLTEEQAKEAAMASMRLIRGSSIDPNFDIRDVRNVDLDGDGVNEVAYRYSAICPNVRYDCPNEVMVMTSKCLASDRRPCRMWGCQARLRRTGLRSLCMVMPMMRVLTFQARSRRLQSRATSWA